MKIRTVSRCVHEGFKSVFKNGLMSLASIGTITACLIILGIVYCLVTNVQSLTKSISGNLGMVAFLKAGITDEEVSELEAELDARDDIESYHYVSGDEAWSTFRSEMLSGYELSDDVASELNSDNPLKDSANIEIYPKEADDQEAIVEFLKTSPYVRKVSYSANASKALSSLSQLASYIGAGLILLLVLVALLLITNTIKLSVFIRKQEINIMKYIGATDSFVRLPFIIEGIIIGILGAILPTLLIYFGYEKIVSILLSRYSSITSLFQILPVTQIMHGLIPIFLVLSVVVGVLGSSISLRKYLKV